MCRWVAKNIVAAQLAERVEIQAAYAIGYPEPTSITIDCFGTNKVPKKLIEKPYWKFFLLSQLILLASWIFFVPFTGKPHIMVILEKRIYLGSKQSRCKLFRMPLGNIPLFDLFTLLIRYITYDHNDRNI